MAYPVKVLVTGAGGMLGNDVVGAAEVANHDVVGLERADLDVTDARAVARAMRRERPQGVINCAAWTNVDLAEEEPEAAARVNVEAARHVAATAADHGAAVVHVSTDYAFDGTKGEPYLETDPVNPVSVYGKTKLAGELEVGACNPRHFVVRSSWLFGVNGGNFVETMLRIAQDQDEVMVVRDQMGCPTYTAHLAEGLVRLLDTNAYGVHHMAADGGCSWYDFAVEIFDQAGVSCRVLSCTSEEYARPAPRPANSVLHTAWPDAIHLPHWKVGLESYLAERAEVPA
jgi:dTDP-4-dehydrorhamnose reductase